MSNLNLRTITNHFQDVRLVSLASWKQAAEFSPRDHGGPYVVLQEGYDPGDAKMTPNEFILGRSGQWLAVGRFYRLPVPDRRAEFIFGTAAEIMMMMRDLPSKVAMFGHAEKEEAVSAAPPSDEMAIAIQTGKSQGGGTASTKPK
jgi:hypothetical protein